MASNIVEFFGYSPSDSSPIAIDARTGYRCPWVGGNCTKFLRDGTPSGACTLQPGTGDPVVICPLRLYANNYAVLLDVAVTAFGPGVRLIRGDAVRSISHDGRNVAVFGKNWGKELRLPSRGGLGSYFVDWILALIDAKGNLEEFVAVEVQAIDTTGNYRSERDAYLASKSFSGKSTAGLNWENVNKRILPQIIYKGNVLQREALCKKGLFFITPQAVYQRICARLGSKLPSYPLQPGALTFLWYDVGPPAGEGSLRGLVKSGQFTSTVNQVAVAWTAPTNLPPPNVYETAIRAELK